MKVWKIIALVVAGCALLAILATTAMLALTAQARDTGRQFALLNSTGDHSTANALLHEELAREFTPERLAAAFQGARPYVQIRFTSVKADGSGTRLTGTARTADGCVSRLNYDILMGQILAFNIAPLCRN